MLRKRNIVYLEAVFLCFTSFAIYAVSAGFGYKPGSNKPSRLSSGSIDLLSEIDNNELNKSVNFAMQIVEGMKRLEMNLDWSNIHISTGSPSHGQFIDSAPETEALNQGISALTAAKATMQLMNVHCSDFSLNPTDCIKQISQLSLASTPLSSSCPANYVSCTQQQLNSPYYSADGSCNNKIDSLLGRSFSGYKRLLPASYIDAVQEPRTRSIIKKQLLPSPRLISTTLNKHRVIQDKKLTLALMQWSQFIEHDLVHTASHMMVHFNKTIECCDSDGTNLSPRYIHPFCQPISIPGNDPFYSKNNIDCMTYTRSVTAMKADCTLGEVEQMNQATHFLDASQIYGSNDRQSHALRLLKQGLLNFKRIDGLEFLPTSTNPIRDCQGNNGSCFISGDSRVNFQPQLTAMHMLWLREHNRIALYLSDSNPNWSDETVYQETRRIVIAEMQHITYNEWLPIILGTKRVSKLQRSDLYSTQVDPRVSNSFATAGLRFLNSLMEDKLNLYTENRTVYSTLNLREHFNRPHVVEETNNLDGLVRGLSTQLSQRLDLDYAEDITTHLYTNGIYGLDIFSLDIQRGRDHGLPTYSSFRTVCGLPKIKDFCNLSDVMLPETIALLKTLYPSPEDIDLLVGGMSEKSIGDSLLGPTMSCIISEQLQRTRRGDRYFYDNSQQPKPFTEEQRAEIEKSSLARVFCDNSDDIQFMQPNVFRKISQSNALSSCIGSGILYMNLSKWVVSKV